MVENRESSGRSLRPLTHLAFVISVVVAAAWFLYVFGQNSDFYPRGFVDDPFGSIIWLGGAAIAGIVMDIAGGLRGGRDRRVAIAAGAILFSPLATIIVANVVWSMTQN